MVGGCAHAVSVLRDLLPDSQKKKITVPKCYDSSVIVCQPRKPKPVSSRIKILKQKNDQDNSAELTYQVISIPDFSQEDHVDQALDAATESAASMPSGKRIRIDTFKLSVDHITCESDSESSLHFDAEAHSKSNSESLTRKSNSTAKAFKMTKANPNSESLTRNAKSKSNALRMDKAKSLPASKCMSKSALKTNAASGPKSKSRLQSNSKIKSNSVPVPKSMPEARADSDEDDSEDEDQEEFLTSIGLGLVKSRSIQGRIENTASASRNILQHAPSAVPMQQRRSFTTKRQGARPHDANVIMQDLRRSTRNSGNLPR
jgi:hypothetical protein